jgi:hypothetical protein
MEIICPRCKRMAKFINSNCKEKDRKKIILNFPCYHYADLVYNVPSVTDKNTIIKDFKFIEESYFNKTYYLSNFGDRRLP